MREVFSLDLVMLEQLAGTVELEAKRYKRIRDILTRFLVGCPFADRVEQFSRAEQQMRQGRVEVVRLRLRMALALRP